MTCVDKLTLWLETGGTLRLVKLSDDYAIVDLCSCSGERLERYSTDHPVVVSQLRADESGLIT